MWLVFRMLLFIKSLLHKNGAYKCRIIRYHWGVETFDAWTTKIDSLATNTLKLKKQAWSVPTFAFVQMKSMYPEHLDFN